MRGRNRLKRVIGDRVDSRVLRSKTDLLEETTIGCGVAGTDRVDCIRMECSRFCTDSAMQRPF